MPVYRGIPRPMFRPHRMHGIDAAYSFRCHTFSGLRVSVMCISVSLAKQGRI